MRRYLSLTLVALLVLFVPGCGGTPDEPTALRDGITAARDEAEAAQGTGDRGTARKAAERAGKYLEKLREISAGQGAKASEAKGFIAECDRAARATRHWADLAEEEYQLEKKLGSLKAAAYRGARKLALKAVFKGMSLAADQAAKKGTKNLPQEVRDAAEMAAEFAAQFAGRKPLADGSPDWAGIATDMNGFASQPPEKLSLYLGAGFFLLARNNLALYELHMTDTSKLDENEKLMHGVGLALVYRANGWTRLAIRQAERVLKLEGEREPEVQAGLHLLSAVFFVMDKDYPRADAEIARALKADPNNPLAVYVTGERLAASGEWEKAADSLEKSAKQTSGDEWLARQISERARKVRDSQGGDEPLLYDKKFMARVVMHYLAEAAKESEAVRKALSWIESARKLGSGLLDKLPGGEKAEQPPEILGKDKTDAPPITTSESVVKQFKQFCSKRKFNEYPEVLAEAKRIFVAGRVVKGYPNNFPPGNVYQRVAGQLKREGVDREGLRGIRLFSGGDGIISHDIVLVVVDKTGETIGVYHVPWGR
jgi:hypothetical protein